MLRATFGQSGIGLGLLTDCPGTYLEVSETIGLLLEQSRTSFGIISFYKGTPEVTKTESFWVCPEAPSDCFRGCPSPPNGHEKRETSGIRSLTLPVSVLLTDALSNWATVTAERYCLRKGPSTRCAVFTEMMPFTANRLAHRDAVFGKCLRLCTGLC